MKKITKIFKQKIKNAHLSLSSYIYLKQGNFEIYFLYELKKLYIRMEKEPEFNINNFKVRAKKIIKREIPNDYKELWVSEYSFRDVQKTFLNIIDEEAKFLKSYLSETDFNEFNATDFLVMYEYTKEERVDAKEEERVDANKQKEKDRVFEKARKLYDSPRKKAQAVRLLSYYNEIRDLKLSGNLNERLCKLSKLINRDIEKFTTIFTEPYRKSDKKAETIKKRLEEIKNIFKELNIDEPITSIDNDIQNRLN